MRKILIVDDNPDILQVMELLLGSRGFEIDVTTRGEETFVRIEEFQPGLIFLDIHLSGIDGRDICRQIKTSDQYRNLPVILFSANKVKHSTIIESLSDAFISKPFDIVDLVEKIDMLLPQKEDSESMIA